MKKIMDVETILMEEARHRQLVSEQTTGRNIPLFGYHTDQGINSKVKRTAVINSYTKGSFQMVETGSQQGEQDNNPHRESNR